MTSPGCVLSISAREQLQPAVIRNECVMNTELDESRLWPPMTRMMLVCLSVCLSVCTSVCRISAEWQTEREGETARARLAEGALGIRRRAGGYIALAIRTPLKARHYNQQAINSNCYWQLAGCTKAEGIYSNNLTAASRVNGTACLLVASGR